MDDLMPVLVCLILFVGLPWIIFHYITKWKQAPRMTDEDEKLLDEMYNLARRLEDRLNTVERIVAADHPDWKPLPSAAEPVETYQSFETFERSRRN
jgi:phage shock protein B